MGGEWRGKQFFINFINFLIPHDQENPSELPWWLRQKRTCLQCRRPKIRSLDQEDPLEKGMEIHSSILAWRIAWKKEPSGLQSIGSQRVRHDWAGLTTSRQAGLRKGWETRDQIANICWIIEKAREFQKSISISASVTMQKTLTVDHNKLRKIFRDGNTRPPYLPPEKPKYAGQEATELDME